MRPVPPPKPVVSSPTVRMNTHLQSAQNLLNELIQIDHGERLLYIPLGGGVF